MKAIIAKKVLYIKLGEAGCFEQNCIENAQTLRLSYRHVNYELCIQGEWDLVRNYFLSDLQCNASTASNHTNQIKQFYLEDELTLWVTFYSNNLWWCFSQPNVTLLDDGTKTRPVIGKWSNMDIYGTILSSNNLSGKLLSLQGFRGTICKVKDYSYIIDKINGIKPLNIIEAEEAYKNLKCSIGKVIQQFQWQDFELLIDLIFSNSGWQRVSILGKTQKTFDFELLSPITNEKALVQIKSQSTLKEFKEYVARFSTIVGYQKHFYVVHSADKSLLEFCNFTNIALLTIEDIAELVISSGLVKWTLQKGC